MMLPPLASDRHRHGTLCGVVIDLENEPYPDSEIPPAVTCQATATGGRLVF